MKKQTQVLLDANKKYLPIKMINKISSITASLFSIIFSMSIIKEAMHFIQEWYIVVLLIVFIILFLVFNEYRKVIELRNKFLKKGSSLFIIILTFMVSFCLSGIGIYLWTNKTLENEVQNDKIIVSERLDIENRYNALIDSVNALDISKNSEYIQIKADIDYWKSRSAATLEERTYIREQTEKVQQDMSHLYTIFNQDKENNAVRYEKLKQVELSTVETNFNNNKKFISRANKISFIFFMMVVITELIIILLAKEFANQIKSIENLSKSKLQATFLQQYRAITEILLRKDKIEFNDVLYSPYFKFSKEEEKHTKEVRSIYYLFGDLKILEVPLKSAQNILKNYYETLFNI
jgi:hypothetical protein